MFVLAEPEDVVIVCGEFNSGVEIISESWEPEQVFTVTKIIQHPDYKPTSVGQQKFAFETKSHTYNILPRLVLEQGVEVQ